MLFRSLLGMDADDIVGCFNARNAHGGSARAEPKVARLREPLSGGRGAGRLGMVAALLALSGLFLFQTREPVHEHVAAPAQPLTVETARGEQRLAAAGTPVLSGAN